MSSSQTRKRPRVICHMGVSIDGRIVTGGWPDSAAVSKEYECAPTTSSGWRIAWS
jgi:2,5-diamino-6-(ribosylamino)-4(3H)-pyrimidinone 5'-phosphate reductase